MSDLRLTSPCCILLTSLVLATPPVCLAKTAPPPPPTYCVTDLGSLANEETRANDINNSTEIVGTSSVGNLVDHPFHWANGVMLDLDPVVAGSSTSANRINEYGWIVGTGRDAGGVYQAYYTHGVPDASWRKIFHPGNSAAGWGVNDNVQMVGTYTVNSGPGAGPHPYVFQPRFGIIDLGLVSGSGRGEAFTINNVPQVGGTSQSLVGDCGAPGYHTPVLWKEVSFGQWAVTILPTDGRCNAYVMAINESNVAVGFTRGLFPSPVVWRHGHSWIIQFLEAGELGLGAAMDVNESGQIVGFTNSATLWTNTGQRYDLNTLVDADEWDLVSASAINDQGQIVGTGYLDGEIRAYLLTPKPPLTSCP